MIRALVVDSDPAVRALLNAVLRRSDIDAECVADGMEALDALRTGGYRVLILDLRMPGADALLRELAVRASKPRVILATTATELPRSLAGYGVEAVLLKPFDIEELAATIHACSRTAPADPFRGESEWPFGGDERWSTN